MCSFHFIIAEAVRKAEIINQNASYALWQMRGSWNGLLTVWKWEKYHPAKNTRSSESFRTLEIKCKLSVMGFTCLRTCGTCYVLYILLRDQDVGVS